MEQNEHDFLEELLALRRETWETIPTEMNEFLSNGWSFDCYNENPAGFIPNSCFEGFSQSLQHNIDQSFSHFHHPFGDELSEMHITADSSYNMLDTPPSFPTHEDYPFSMMENEEVGVLGDDLRSMEMQASCKMEQIQSTESAPAFNMGVCLERKNRSKKVQGQPSKNLMAERRRRKRLNDRLSMLRSIVPKISKVIFEVHSFFFLFLLPTLNPHWDSNLGYELNNPSIQPSKKNKMYEFISWVIH